MGQIRQAALIAVLVAGLGVLAVGQNPRFFPDDPIQAMPASVSVQAPSKRDINPIYDFLVKAKFGAPQLRIPAGAINTLGEVPDSEWFTNRHARRRLTPEELRLGPGRAEAAQPPFTVTSSKADGVTPGFRMEDAKGRRYFAKLDPVGHCELGTAAEVIGSKFFHAIGFNTPRNEIVYLKQSDLRVSDKARITQPNGRERKMTPNDVVDIVQNGCRNPDGSFRIIASLAIEGDYIGPFRYEGTRTDDPNDITPHENRRDLRGLYVFAAWLNNTDMRAANTLDTVVEENGVRFIRHYLMDFGSALGSNGDRPKDARSGNQFAVPTATIVFKRLLTLGFVPEPWERFPFSELPATGKFTSEMFNPDEWKSIFPNTAFLSRLPGDDFWAAKQVMAFSDDDIRAIVNTGEFRDARSAEYIVTTLAKRRNLIGQTMFAKVLPLDHFRIENEQLQFEDLAVTYGFQGAQPYDIAWSRFDNVTQEHDPIEGRGAQLPAQARQAAIGSYFSAAISAAGDPHKLSIYVRKERAAYKIVGIDRGL